MKSLRNVLPVLCVLNLLLFMLLAQHWWLGGLVGLLIGGAFYLTCLPAPERPALGQLLRQVLPAWQGNVQLARSQTQAAIDNLTTRFGGIHDRLGGAIDLSQGGRNAEVLQVIQNAAQQLGGIASALESVLTSRQALLTKFEMLLAGNEEIRQLALQNEQLAGQTGTTDLFSDPQSWQELAARSADNSRQIVARVKGMRQQIQAAQGAAGASAASAEELAAGTHGVIENSRAVIDRVVADFRQFALQLSGTVEQLESESREVDREVCEILVNLQFQDRISQILDHVQRDILRLLEASGQDRLPSPEQWLEQLQNTYTTQEQRQLHAGGPVAAGPQSSQFPQSQVDFF